MALVKVLQRGGYVLVMRHANAPPQAPDEAMAAVGNLARERQLDEPGRAEPRAIGDGVRQLKVPMGEIFASPKFRARQTVQIATLGQPILIPQLDEGAQGMQSGRLGLARRAPVAVFQD